MTRQLKVLEAKIRSVPFELVAYKRSHGSEILVLQNMDDDYFCYQFRSQNHLSREKGSYHSEDEAMEQAIAELERSQSGFTLIEVLVITIIIGILTAIAAPSWLNFVENQRIAAANGGIFRAIEETKSIAKREQITYKVQFRQGAEVPEVSIYQGLVPGNWRSLSTESQGIEISPKLIKINSKGNFDGDDDLPVKVVVTKGNLKRCTNVVTLLAAIRQGQGDACD
jgi:prepilin-type N-terminal cleavage/methylation domain-containing protein